MRLRQEFRSQRVTLKVRRGALVAAWALAAAAVLAGAVRWRNWRHSQHEEATNYMNSVPDTNKFPENSSVAGANHQTPAEVPNGIQQQRSAGAGSSEKLMAVSQMSGFPPLLVSFSAHTASA